MWNMETKHSLPLESYIVFDMRLKKKQQQVNQQIQKTEREWRDGKAQSHLFIYWVKSNVNRIEIS